MTQNNNDYCLVDTRTVDIVVEGPRKLPKNWLSPFDEIQYYNLNVRETWDDTALLGIGWYLCFITIPVYDPATQYLGDWTFQILTDRVNAEREVVNKTQGQIDQEESTSIVESQRVARDLADQTEAILITNSYRNDIGADPIIPASDVADVNVYLGQCYAAVDDPAVLPIEPPAATRQVTEVPGENISRAVIRRIRQTWNVPDDVYGLSYWLYPGPVDPTGMSVKIHDGTTGGYLYTMTLLPPGDPGNPTDPADNCWYAETPSGAWGQHLELKPWQYVLFYGVDISQMRTLPVDEEEQRFDVRWLGDSTLAGAVS